MQVTNAHADFRKYSVKSSAMRLVSVVTSTRSCCSHVAALFQQVIYLTLNWMNFDLRIGKPSPDDCSTTSPPISSVHNVPAWPKHK